MTLWGQQITTQKLLFLKFYFQSLGNRQTPAGRLPQRRNLRERTPPANTQRPSLDSVAEMEQRGGLLTLVSPPFPPEAPVLSHLLGNPQHPYLNCLFELKLPALASYHLQLKSLH